MADSLGIEKEVQNLLAELGGEKSNEVLKHYHGKFAALDMFRYLWGVEEAHTFLTPEIQDPRKSKEESEKYRKEGNKAYEKKKLSEALKLYNKSILSAPHPPLHEVNNTSTNGNPLSSAENANDSDLEALPLAYANRSAVLFELKQFDDCLSDIQRALEYGYPEAMRHKLAKRKEGCNEALNSCTSGSPKRLLTRHLTKPPRVLGEVNPAIPAMSSAVKLAISPSAGRYLVAQRQIMSGEVLLVEDIYSRCLYHQHLQTHCNTCFTRCLIPLPCPSCSEVIFCSNECREEGLSGQHAIECHILPVLGAMNSCMVVPFRILTRTPFRNLIKLLKQYRAENEIKSQASLGFSEKGIYDTNDYRSIYCLVTNKEKREGRSLFTICSGAFILTKVLFHAKNYFLDESRRPIEPSTEDLVEVGSALFHHIMSDLCNGHRYGELQVSEGPDGNPDIQNIGAWISPTLSLANHSCDQTVVTCNKGNLGVMTAIQLIQPGQEITTGYLKGYGTQSLSMRREILAKHYFFECVCQACKENWPTFGNLPDNYQMKCLRCFHFINRSDGQCSDCAADYTNDTQETYNWKIVDQDIGLAVLGFLRMRRDFKMNRLDVKYEDIKAATRVIEIMNLYVMLPNKIYANAKAFLAGLLRNQRDYLQIKEGFS